MMSLKGACSLCKVVTKANVLDGNRKELHRQMGKHQGDACQTKGRIS